MYKTLKKIVLLVALTLAVVCGSVFIAACDVVPDDGDNGGGGTKVTYSVTVSLDPDVEGVTLTSLKAKWLSGSTPVGEEKSLNASGYAEIELVAGNYTVTLTGLDTDSYTFTPDSSLTATKHNGAITISVVTVSPVTLDPPANVKVVSELGIRLLTWDPVTGADSYNVYLNDGTDPVANVKDKVYTIPDNLTPGTYSYTVQSVGDDVNYLTGTASAASADATFKVLTKLNTPTNVLISDGSDDTYKVLSWDGDDNASYYTIYDNGDELTSTPNTTYDIVLENLSVGDHYFTVAAVGDNLDYESSLPSTQSADAFLHIEAVDPADIIVGTATDVSGFSSLPFYVEKTIDLNVGTYTIIVTGAAASHIKVSDTSNVLTSGQAAAAGEDGFLVVPEKTSTAVAFSVSTKDRYTLKIMDYLFCHDSCTIKVEQGNANEIPAPKVEIFDPVLTLDVEKEISLKGDWNPVECTFTAPKEGNYKIILINSDGKVNGNIDNTYEFGADYSTTYETFPKVGTFPAVDRNAQPGETISIKFSDNGNAVTFKVKVEYVGLATIKDVEPGTTTPGFLPFVSLQDENPYSPAKILFKDLKNSYKYSLELTSFQGQITTGGLVYNGETSPLNVSDDGKFTFSFVADATVLEAELYIEGSMQRYSFVNLTLTELEFVDNNAPVDLGEKTVDILTNDWMPVSFAALDGIGAGTYKLVLTDDGGLGLLDGTVTGYCEIKINISGRGGAFNKTTNEIQFTLSGTSSSSTITVETTFSGTLTLKFHLYKLP